MKIVVTYEREDLLRLIMQDLKTNGLKYDLATAKFKGSAKFVIEVEGSPGEPVESVEEAVSDVAPPVRVAKVAEPAADDDSVDLDAIMEQSKKNANDKPGIYPDRQLMDGESYDWPGAPVPRGR